MTVRNERYINKRTQRMRSSPDWFARRRRNGRPPARYPRLIARIEVSSAAVDVTPAPQVVAPGETLDMRITEAPAWGERDISIAVGKQISEGGLYGAIWEGTMTDKATGEVKNIALKQFDPKQSDWGHMLEIMNVHSALQQVGLPVPTLYAITSDVGSLQQFAVMENFNVNGFVALSANNESALVAPQSIGVISNFDDAARSMVQTSLRVAEQGISRTTTPTVPNRMCP